MNIKFKRNGNDDENNEIYFYIDFRGVRCFIEEVLKEFVLE